MLCFSVVPLMKISISFYVDLVIAYLMRGAECINLFLVRFQVLRELIPNSEQKRDTASFLLEVLSCVMFLCDF